MLWLTNRKRQIGGYFDIRAATTMSNLPCELLDHIVDLLHDSKTPLKNSCLVSKSWVARTRRHLFAEVHFRTAQSLESWKKTFPDPSTSPARYAKALFIHLPQVVTTAAVGEGAGCWVGGFPHVVCLAMVGGSKWPLDDRWGESFALFHGISPVIKSLRVDFVLCRCPQLFDLILSFPLLEDLSVTSCHLTPFGFRRGSDGPSTPSQPSSLPMFSGSLELDISGGMKPFVRRLLSLSGGMHFRKFIFVWYYEENIPLMMALVERCSHTLKSLDIARNTSHGKSVASAFVRKQLTLFF